LESWQTPTPRKQIVNIQEENQPLDTERELWVQKKLDERAARLNSKCLKRKRVELYTTKCYDTVDRSSRQSRLSKLRETDSIVQ
jgi:hypothetical protein